MDAFGKLLQYRLECSEIGHPTINGLDPQQKLDDEYFEKCQIVCHESANQLEGQVEVIAGMDHSAIDRSLRRTSEGEKICFATSMSLVDKH